MIHHVVIKPTAQNDQMLPTIYTDKASGKTRFMTSETDYREIYANDKEYATQIAHALTFTLSRKNKPTLEYTFETGPDGTGVTAQDKKIDALCHLYWAQHPQFTVNGDASKNKNFSVDRFDILFVQDEKKLKYAEFKKILSIVTRVTSMSIEDKRNVAYYFGHSPKGLTEADLDMFLVDFNTGIALKPANAKQFVDVWMKETDTERDYIVNTQKAINLGIFKSTSDNGRTNYTYDQQFIGTAFNDVLAFCKREDRVYNDHILREIKLSDEKEAKRAEKDKVAAKSGKPVKKAEPITPAIPNAEAKAQVESFGERAKAAGIA